MWKKLGTVAALGAIALAPALTQAPSATALSSWNLYSGDGDTLRLRLYEHANFGGADITYFGSSTCSTTTTDADYSRSNMPSADWNDKVSSVRDYNYCDIKLYEHVNFTGATWGYVNASTAGRNVPSSMNDKTSSFRVS